jgi:protoporphyrinogen oxidase
MLFSKGLLLSPFSSSDKQNIKSLIEEFQYPKKGPGMLWEEVARKVISKGGVINLGTEVIGCELDEQGQWVLRLADGSASIAGPDVISSAPIKTILNGLKPEPPSEIKAMANEFKYRDFVTVVLMFKLKDSFPDNWIYIHDESVRVARIQNYKNWSPEMVPSEEYTSYGLEYFCQQDDDFWNLSDDELFALALKEVQEIGLPFSRDELDYKVVRVEKAYPVYDHDHSERSLKLREEVKNYPGLHLAGRNGMHRYNNQDHSIKTAMLTAKNIIEGTNRYDTWQVNQDAIYLETEERR